jgi:hypothetical protein
MITYNNISAFIPCIRAHVYIINPHRQTHGCTHGCTSTYIHTRRYIHMYVYITDDCIFVYQPTLNAMHAVVAERKVGSAHEPSDGLEVENALEQGHVVVHRGDHLHRHSHRAVKTCHDRRACTHRRRRRHACIHMGTCIHIYGPT